MAPAGPGTALATSTHTGSTIGEELVLIKRQPNTELAGFKQNLKYCLDLTGNSGIQKESTKSKICGEWAVLKQSVYLLTGLESFGTLFVHLMH